ncbi:hypothetical protein ACFLWL_00180 [Chloroflexota bacterium]
MIEIRYGKQRELADLAGKSVADVREQYSSTFGIPERVRAILNGEPVRKELEDRMMLNDEDALSFEVKSRIKRPAVMLTAFLVTLAISGGVFAYTYTTATATISIGAVTSDFATVSVNSSYSPPTVFGKFTGIWPTGYLYDIVPADGYTGDLVITVYIANTGNLVRYYQHVNMLMEFQDSTGTKMDDQQSAKLLTLQNAEAEFYWSSGNGTSPYYIKMTGGGFRLYRWKTLTGGSVTPIIYCEVTQR